MEKIAIISDIHGNLLGLQAVMADIEACECDRIICLGDMVEGGNYNDEVVRFIRDKKIAAVRGNHDEWNDLDLSIDVQDFIDSISEDILEVDIIYTHISPRNKKIKVTNRIEAWNIFAQTSYRLAFVGHVHVPLIFSEKSEEVGAASEYEFKYGEPFYLEREDRYIISVGAVGYSRDGIQKPRYVVFNKTESSVEFRIVDGEVLSF